MPINWHSCDWENEYKNLLMVEKPNGDFAFTMLREFYFAAFMNLFWTAASSMSNETITGIADKGIKESAYHINHTGEWVVRLGDGTNESNRRLRNAVDDMHSYVDELFEITPALQSCINAGLLPDISLLRGQWDELVNTVFKRAGVENSKCEYPRSGGRYGEHGECFGHLLSELQFMQRTYPGLSW